MRVYGGSTIWLEWSNTRVFMTFAEIIIWNGNFYKSMLDKEKSENDIKI